MRNLIKCLGLCMLLLCLISCGKNKESEQIESNINKIKENEIRLEEIENSEILEEDTEVVYESTELSDEDIITNNTDEGSEDVDANSTEINEDNNTDFLSQSEIESIVLQYISCNNSDSLDVFINSYCSNSNIAVLYNASCSDSKINYSAREVSDDISNYSYIVSFRAEYNSSIGTEFKVGVLKISCSYDKITRIDVESFN